MLLASGRFAEAAKHFEALPVTRFSFPINRFPLAIALDRLGRPNEAISRLEEQEIPHAPLPHVNWPLCRAKLAELYRKVGRIDDAIQVENQLRHYLSEADPDFPILAQLRAVAAGTANATVAK